MRFWRDMFRAVQMGTLASDRQEIVQLASRVGALSSSLNQSVIHECLCDTRIARKEEEEEENGMSSTWRSISTSLPWTLFPLPSTVFVLVHYPVAV